MLNEANYHSQAANIQYFSVSQWKSFKRCEAATMAELRGEYRREISDAMLAGQMVAAWCEGKLNAWVDAHRAIVFNKSGKMYKAFEDATRMCDAMKESPVCMEYIDGHKEVIHTATLFGAEWKIKADIINDEFERIVDVKTTSSIREPIWMKINGKNERATFIDQFDYVTQLAIYCEVHRISLDSSTWYTPYIVAVSKEEPCDIEVIEIGRSEIDSALRSVGDSMSRLRDVKAGKIDPDRCERCEYCRGTRILTGPIRLEDFRELVVM